jgi:RNA-binding protein 5/10
LAPTQSPAASSAAATAKAAAATHDNYGPSTTLSNLLAFDPKIIDTKSQMTPLAKLQPAAIAPAPPSIAEDLAAKAALEENGKKAKAGKDKEPQDKVKVAKNIVKDMEKWAKQLNQKKNMNTFQAPVTSRDDVTAPVGPQRVVNNDTSGYADVGFSILEKKEKGPVTAVPGYLMGGANAAANSKLVSYGSDSDDADHGDQSNEKDYLDYDKLTCLLCKRAFQSLEIFNKHVKMSQLHKDNLQKHNLQKGILPKGGGANYRDRAKERRLKYGEVSPPPVNKSKERFQRDLAKQMRGSTGYQPPEPPVSAVPIGENNVGNKLLQKMGWKDGQGLGRSNQGRTQIIEAEKRVEKSGLGSKMSSYATSGDDYKTYIKKMMKSRYDQANAKD